jgi:hypothetical protein
VHAGVDTDFDTFDGTDRLSRPNLGYHGLSAIRAPCALNFSDLQPPALWHTYCF